MRSCKLTLKGTSTIANLNFPSLPGLAPSWMEVWTSCRGGLHREKLFVRFRRCRKSFCACKPPAPFGKCVIKWWFVTALLPSSLPKACVHRIEMLCELLGGTGFSDSSLIYIYFHPTMKIAYGTQLPAYYGLKCILEISPDSWHIYYDNSKVQSVWDL